jgi:hypothetical protein
MREKKSKNAIRKQSIGLKEKSKLEEKTKKKVLNISIDLESEENFDQLIKTIECILVLIALIFIAVLGKRKFSRFFQQNIVIEIN